MFDYFVSLYNIQDIPKSTSCNSNLVQGALKRPPADLPKLPLQVTPVVFHKWQKDMYHYLNGFPGFSISYLHTPPLSLITAPLITDFLIQVFDYVYTSIIKSINDNDTARLVIGEHYKSDIYTIWTNLANHFFPKDWTSLSTYQAAFTQCRQLRGESIFTYVARIESIVEILQESAVIIQAGTLKQVLYKGLSSVAVQRHLHGHEQLDYASWKIQLLLLD